jgi:peptidoglycan hydrolase-like protein with peptidoglycan-binding domain
LYFVNRSFLALVALTLFGVISVCGDDNITKAQNRLKADGFYFGKPTGIYDSETAAAVTRYRIRHGLAISGKLDAPTAKELGISTSTTESPEKVLAGSWRRLRSGEMQFVEDIPSPHAARPTSPAQASVAKNSLPSISPAPGNAIRPPHASLIGSESENPEPLRDYIAAFVLAGLDPRVGSELEFFAERVNYFGAPNIQRQQIQRDLEHYDRLWPERRFWLEGDIRVERQTDNEIKVAFPLRYELRKGSRRASGKVMKSLTLFKTANNEMQIVAVSERKAR